MIACYFCKVQKNFPRQKDSFRRNEKKMNKKRDIKEKR